jgi:hypothetical protein
MANEARSFEGALVIQLVPLEAGWHGIALLVRQDLMVELADGPWPGVILLAADARRLADLLRIAAEDLEAAGGHPDE